MDLVMTPEERVYGSLLAVLVKDLRYTNAPKYHVHPIRHQMAWLECEEPAR